MVSKSKFIDSNFVMRIVNHIQKISLGNQNRQDAKGPGKVRYSFGQDENSTVYELAFRPFGILKHQKVTNVQKGGVKKDFLTRQGKKETFELRF